MTQGKRLAIGRGTERAGLLKAANLGRHGNVKVFGRTNVKIEFAYREIGMRLFSDTRPVVGKSGLTICR